MDASWCMRQSKDLRSSVPDRIRTSDRPLPSEGSITPAARGVSSRATLASMNRFKNPPRGMNEKQTARNLQIED